MCPVLSPCAYFEHTASAVSCASSLFVSPHFPSLPISNNEVLFF